MEVRRGDLFYISAGKTSGSEQGGIRPAVIISNDLANKYSPVVEVVFLTSQKKKPLPTHVKVKGQTLSIALCEQITSVDRERLLGFIGQATEKEMEQIEKAVEISLGIGRSQEIMSKTITINGFVLPVREYQGQRVLVFRDMDVVHQRSGGTASRYFNQNRTHFTENRDVFQISLTEENKRTMNFISPSATTKVFTMTGYLALTTCYLSTEKDFKIQQAVLESYFDETRDKETKKTETTYTETSEGLMLFRNEALGIELRTVLNNDGSISVSAEDTAIGFGWMQTQVKSGKEYTSIRWETLNGYCKDLGFPNKLGKDDYLPESLYYLLGMKANNERAQKFQRWLALDVIPRIRKTGEFKVQPEKEREIQIDHRKAMEHDPSIYIQAAQIAAALPGGHIYSINCLRHVVPDIDVEPVREEVTVKEEVKTTQSTTVKTTQRGNFHKVGVPCDTAKLKRTMESRNLSIYKMSKLAGVSTSTVKSTLDGLHQPTIETRTKLCMALKVSEDYLTPVREAK